MKQTSLHSQYLPTSSLVGRNIWTLPQVPQGKKRNIIEEGVAAISSFLSLSVDLPNTVPLGDSFMSATFMGIWPCIESYAQKSLTLVLCIAVTVFKFLIIFEQRDYCFKPEVVIISYSSKNYFVLNWALKITWPVLILFAAGLCHWRSSVRLPSGTFLDSMGHASSPSWKPVMAC